MCKRLKAFIKIKIRKTKEIGDYYLLLVHVNFNFMINELVNNLGYVCFQIN